YVVSLQSESHLGGVRQPELALQGCIQVCQPVAANRVPAEVSSQTGTWSGERCWIQSPAAWRLRVFDPHRLAVHYIRSRGIVESESENVLVDEDVERKSCPRSRNAVKAPSPREPGKPA